MIDQFEKLVRERFACRTFEKRPVEDKRIERLLHITSCTPSAYNLQPTHFIVVQSEKVKQKVYEACLKQEHVLSASCIIVFAADRKVVEHNEESIIQEEMKQGNFSDEKAKRYRKFLQFGFKGVFKKMIAPLVRLMNVMPNLPLENFDAWLAKQAALCAMNFMLAAKADGLDTCPLEAFDEKRLKKALDLDRSWYIPMIVVVGYGKPSLEHTTRLPLSEFIQWK